MGPGLRGDDTGAAIAHAVRFEVSVDLYYGASYTLRRVSGLTARRGEVTCILGSRNGVGKTSLLRAIFRAAADPCRSADRLGRARPDAIADA